MAHGVDEREHLGARLLGSFVLSTASGTSAGRQRTSNHDIGYGGGSLVNSYVIHSSIEIGVDASSKVSLCEFVAGGRGGRAQNRSDARLAPTSRCFHILWPRVIIFRNGNK
jgi:hypothetical protein